jgi:hypothetical protein
MKTRFIDLNGYSDCIEVVNENARIVLEPNCGGRILCYEYKGVNALYINPKEDGYLLESGKPHPGPFGPCAGRCDIGPEMTTVPHPELWMGKWSTRIRDERTVELTSIHDYGTGVQLTRIFSLDEYFAKLKFTQTILNIDESPRKYSHWSRTFCTGGGIAIAPLNEESRYPRGYLSYGPGEIINYMPQPEPNVIVRDGLLQICGPAPAKKYAMDLSEGWLAYVTRDSRLFIKKFPVYPGRVYGEMAANNMSFWYNGEEMCEIEPIGPLEIIEPSFDASFTETWYLMEFEYPGRKPVKASDIRKIIDVLVM